GADLTVFKAGLWTAVFLFVLQLTHISAKNIPTYFRPGGTLSLSPTAVPDPVRSVLWTHNGNLVAEWIKDEIELQYYGVFRNRTELNTTTGQLRITQTTEADNGEFSVELNNVIQADRYEARMIQEVPDPYVWVRPNKDLYVLYCDPVPGQEAALQAAEPVSYWWKIGTADWAEFGNKLEVNDNETTRRAETFTCKMVNPVSEKTSQPQKKKSCCRQINVTINCQTLFILLQQQKHLNSVH
uniref:Ig-like domain-containing protein n=1 Tax=Sphaeramia orbicularis TaxID=375764 RepID=A0A673BGG1_9TELE